MKIPVRVAIALLAATFAAKAATAASASGNGALALAALTAAYSPLLPAQEKGILADFLAGHAKIPGHAGNKITVAADSITCHVSNVDLTDHACELVFGKESASLHGRTAHELYATLMENGIPSDGALGTIYEALSKLTCTIDPKKIASKDGSGAECAFSPGAP